VVTYTEADTGTDASSNTGGREGNYTVVLWSVGLQRSTRSEPKNTEADTGADASSNTGGREGNYTEADTGADASSNTGGRLCYSPSRCILQRLRLDTADWFEQASRMSCHCSWQK